MRRAASVGACVLAAALLCACGGAQERKQSYVAQGRALMARGNCEDARVAFRNALYIQPKSSATRVLVGEAAEKCGRLREAAEMYRGAIERDRLNLQARARLARLRVLAGDSRRALVIVAPGLAVAPGDPDLLAVRGIARLRKGDKDGAYIDAERAVQAAPANENAVALLAALHRRSGRSGEAMEVVQRAVELKPRSVEMRLVLAQLLLALGSQESAEAELQQVVKLEPGRLSYRQRLAQLLDAHGWALLQEGEILAASSMLEQAVGQAPESPQLRYHLAMAQLQAGDSAPALRNLQFAVDSGVQFAGWQEARATLGELRVLR